ncbi:uncharacterized protein LOC128202183 isoform X2 [Galleria mellonella]|nr:uncharacterized protein LOC128202183 isoform X2 [Galleria mellonella]XP_052757481.1 uncharacterized protein LOC128202183 isoform X2 [Galleria mellonella]
MEISLKVERHIYNNRPISTANAITYMEEVCSYKAHCLNDPRCLQVIEKLKRSMNAIITEAENFHNLNVNKYEINEVYFNNNQGYISPVYSIVDNDEMETIVVLQNNIDTIKDMPDENIHKNDMIILHSVTDQDGNVQNNSRQISNELNFIDDNIQKQLSILSIKEIEDPTLTNVNSNNEMCSQSIIPDNFKDVNDITDIKNTEIKEQDKTLIIHGSHNNVTLKSRSKVITDFTTKAIIYNVPQNEIAHTATNIKTAIKTTNVEKKKTIKRNKAKINVTRNINKSVNSKKGKKVEGNFTKPVKKVVSLANEIPTKSVVKTNEPEILKQLNPDEYLAQIHNKTVENNLSWLENIRYVRQVGADETDPKLTYLNESFWNDYTLPNGWSDQEFF